MDYFPLIFLFDWSSNVELILMNSFNMVDDAARIILMSKCAANYPEFISDCKFSLQ